MSSGLAHKVMSFIEGEDLFLRENRLLVAVSGGLDSVVLAHLLHALGYAIEIGHYNYRLRGADSDGDAEFVSQLASGLDVKFWFQSSNDIELARLQNENLQAVARQLRYDWLLETASHSGCRYVCTAHHLDDNLETLLLQLTRGTSLTGLAGMSPKLDNGVVRPLLGCSRKELENYARKNKLSWREDQTNASDDYKRNYLRHHVTPLLQRVQEDGTTRLANTFERLRTDEQLFQLGLDALWEKALVAPSRIDRKALPSDERQAEALLYYKLRPLGFKGDHFRQMLTAKSGTVIYAVGGDASIVIRKEVLELYLGG